MLSRAVHIAMDLCRDVLTLIEESNRIAVVHHWDSDGIASAALIEKVYAYRKALSFTVPRIGLYRASAIPIENLRHSNPDILLILDYGLSREDLEHLEKKLGITIAVIDHHVTQPRDRAFCNPIAMGSSEDLYPATTYVLYRALDLDTDTQILDLVALGIVGDFGWRPRLDLTRWIPEYSGSLELLKHVASIVDSCYRLGDYDCIRYVRRKLTKAGLSGIVSDTYLESKYRRVDNELRYLLETLQPSERRGPLLIFRAETESYITSFIGRELAKRFPNSMVILINKVRSLGMGYIYVRSLSHRLRDVLEELRAKGLEVGGKDMVFVVTCKSLECDEERDVLYALEAHLKSVLG